MVVLFVGSCAIYAFLIVLDIVNSELLKLAEYLINGLLYDLKSSFKLSSIIEYESTDAE